MSNPLRYDSDALYEMNDDQLNYLSYVVSRKIALDNTGTGSLNINGSGTLIGSAVETSRQDPAGTHPTDGAFNNVTYNFYQKRNSVNPNPVRPVSFNSEGVRVMNNSALTNNVTSKVLDQIISGGIGSYALGTSTEINNNYSGSFVLIANILDKVNKPNGNRNVGLYRKIDEEVPPVVRPLKVRSDNHLQEMSDDDIETLADSVREYMLATGRGFYSLSELSPSGGTWIYRGEFEDRYLGTDNERYTSIVTFIRERTSTLFFTGSYLGPVTFLGGYTGAASFSQQFGGSTAFYAGEAVYTGGYVSDVAFTGTYDSDVTYTGNYNSEVRFTGLTVTSSLRYGERYRLWVKVR